MPTITSKIDRSSEDFEKNTEAHTRLVEELNDVNDYVMKGGLNKWIETIIQPPRPKLGASDQELAIYTFRKAASMFFGGGGTAVNNDSGALPVFSGKKKGNAGMEGC